MVVDHPQQESSRCQGRVLPVIQRQGQLSLGKSFDSPRRPDVKFKCLGMHRHALESTQKWDQRARTPDFEYEGSDRNHGRTNRAFIDHCVIDRLMAALRCSTTDDSKQMWPRPPTRQIQGDHDSGRCRDCGEDLRPLLLGHACGPVVDPQKAILHGCQRLSVRVVTSSPPSSSASCAARSRRSGLRCCAGPSSALRAGLRGLPCR